jgi:hypothetical protein
MNQAPTDHTNDAPLPSIESARDKAFNGLARQAIGGGLTLDEYAQRAAATQQAATGDELNALLQGQPEDAAGALAARRPHWLVSVLAGRQRRGRWRLGDHLWVIAVFTLPPFPGSPLIRMRAFSLSGGVKLDDRPPRNLPDRSRARSSKSTSAHPRSSPDGDD